MTTLSGRSTARRRSARSIQVVADGVFEHGDFGERRYFVTPMW